ncbi:MAG: hypothetical protein IKJ60_03140 [Ruminococcus sp.]|nr:hypothetical protein [Ruminococcus sp.]
MPTTEKRESFENFKSNMCHMLRREGDLQFLKNVIINNLVMEYYHKNWLAECLYTLAMLDYVCRINDIPLVTNYNTIRCLKMKEIIYPASLSIYSKVMNQPNILTEAYENSIPEFKRFNIVENEVRNVV